MANTHLTYPDLALVNLSGTDPQPDSESLVQLAERKNNFALGDAPADTDELVNYTFRNKALFSTLLRGPAAEWYENTIENATTWTVTREQFITRFSDGWNKSPHKMEVEHCVLGDGEEIRTFLHRIKKIFDKDGLMTKKVLQKVIRLQNVWNKADKEDNDTLTILCEDCVQGTYNEKPRNNWWRILTQMERFLHRNHPERLELSNLFELPQWWGTD